MSVQRGVPVARRVRYQHAAASNINTGDTATKVIILAYMRSGSTLTADLFNYNPDAFYIYEPLHHLYLNKRRSKFPILFQNKTYRIAATDKDNVEIGLQIMKSFLTCDLHGVDIGTLLYGYMNKSETTRPFFNCVSQSNGILRIPTCLEPLIAKCKQAKHRVIKVILSSMELAEQILNSVKNVKVIHLLRDPRAVVASRVRVGAVSKRAIEGAGGQLCQEMMENIKTGDRVKRKHPKALRTLLYESITTSPLLATQEIYKFIGGKVPNVVMEWVFNNTMSGRRNTCAYCTTRANSSATAHAWRSYMPVKIAKTIDGVCQPIYERLGYLNITDGKSLKNSSISLRKNNVPFWIR